MSRRLRYSLVVVEAVADHELVRDVPADVLHVDVHPQRLGLAQQGADLDRGGVAGGQVGGQPAQGQAGVDDLVDDQHVAAGDVGVEVLEDADDAGALRAGAVRRDRHPVHLEVPVERPRHVGHHHHRAAEDADDEQVLALVVLLDLLGPSRRCRARISFSVNRMLTRSPSTSAASMGAACHGDRREVSAASVRWARHAAVRTRPRARPQRPDHRRRPRGDAEPGARRRGARLPPLLAGRAPQHAGGRGDQPAAAHLDGRGGHLPDPGRLGRRDAAQPRAAGRGRAVRAARGGVPRTDRPRHRPRARHPTRSPAGRCATAAAGWRTTRCRGSPSTSTTWSR